MVEWNLYNISNRAYIQIFSSFVLLSICVIISVQLSLYLWSYIYIYIYISSSRTNVRILTHPLSSRSEQSDPWAVTFPFLELALWIP